MIINIKQRKIKFEPRIKLNCNVCFQNKITLQKYCSYSTFHCSIPMLLQVRVTALQLEISPVGNNAINALSIIKCTTLLWPESCVLGLGP